jgi:hypothetical protein
MSLPMKAIDRVFERMATAYGAQWARMWEGVPVQDVKTAWCHELSAFGDSAPGMRRIAWALDNLPDRAPNMIQFRNLCRQAPAEAVPQLPEPPADPERIRAELAKLGHLDKAKRMPVSEAIDPKAWAKGHVSHHSAGYKVRPIVLLFARQALGGGPR